MQTNIKVKSMTMNDNFYTDQELRAMCLTHAVRLIDTDWCKARGEFNTTTINAVLGELVNLVKYGTITAPTVTEADVAPAPEPVNAEPLVQNQMVYA